MQLLKNQGSYEVLTTNQGLKNQLLRIERAGRTCYQSYHGRELNQESSKKFIKMLIRRGHLSVVEHSSLTVRFTNVSRGFTHEMVRHRLASYSQESTRYVDYAKKGDSDLDLDAFSIKVVCPPHKNPSEKVEVSNDTQMSFEDMIEQIESFYRSLRKAGWNPEDARQLLPIGLKAEIVVTANLREWRHIFKMRTSKYAHWEIRSVMVDLLEELKPVLSPVFDDFQLGGTDNNGVKYYEKGQLN